MPDESPGQIADEIQRLLRQAILDKFPNPERRGCLGEAVLREVARRRLPIQDAHWEHVTHCSPCFREFIGFRQEMAASRRRLVRRNRVLLASVLAVAGVVGLVAWRNSPAPVPPAMVAEASFDVDMRPFSVSRGDSEKQPAANHYGGILARSRGRLNVILPIGAEEGTYEVRLMDNDLRAVLISGEASATFQDHLVRLAVRFDLTKIPPGRYVLASRRDNGSWMTCPVLIR
jgi:hypothetical protein